MRSQAVNTEMFEEIFANKKLNSVRLSAYGFEFDGKIYRYSRKLMGDSFELCVKIDLCGKIGTSLFDNDSGEEYTLYKTDAQGAFVGDVRKAVAEVLSDITDTCFDYGIFKQRQTLDLIAHADKVYGDKPDFLMKRAPDSGFLRRKDNLKWYVAILKIPKSKLGFKSDQTVEIANLHAAPEHVARLLLRPNFYPAWHMNKKHWYTVILDGSVENEELFALVEESYLLSKK